MGAAINDVLRKLNRTLQNVNPQSVLDTHMARAAQSLEVSLPQVQAAITDAKRANTQGLVGEELSAFIQRFITNKLGAVPLGPMPHTLRFLGAPMQMLKIDTGVLYKIFFNEGKHAAEMENVTPAQLVRELYEPTLVLKTADKGQFDLVLNIQGAQGPLLVPVKLDTQIDPTRETDQKVAVIKTVFGKPLIGEPGAIGTRILKGDVLYADTGKVGQPQSSLTSGPSESKNSSRSVVRPAPGGNLLKGESRLTKLQSVLGNAYSKLMPTIKKGMVRPDQMGPAKCHIGAQVRTITAASFVVGNWRPRPRRVVVLASIAPGPGERSCLWPIGIAAPYAGAEGKLIEETG